MKAGRVAPISASVSVLAGPCIGTGGVRIPDLRAVSQGPASPTGFVRIPD